MCKVAGLDPQKLHELHAAGDHETRNQLANRAGAVVTSELQRLWKDRQLKVRFSPDAEHLDTVVADPNSVYDVEVNLDERSRGLKWFFSFYITFSADAPRSKQLRGRRDFLLREVVLFGGGRLQSFNGLTHEASGCRLWAARVGAQPYGVGGDGPTGLSSPEIAKLRDQ
jgi:hypothetical protein